MLTYDTDDSTEIEESGLVRGMVDKNCGSSLVSTPGPPFPSSPFESCERHFKNV